jgi:hypothetical protein
MPRRPHWSYRSAPLRYHLRCIEDLHAMLAKRDDWMPFGIAEEQ